MKLRFDPEKDVLVNSAATWINVDEPKIGSMRIGHDIGCRPEEMIARTEEIVRAVNAIGPDIEVKGVNLGPAITIPVATVNRLQEGSRGKVVLMKQNAALVAALENIAAGLVDFDPKIPSGIMQTATAANIARAALDAAKAKP